MNSVFLIEDFTKDNKCSNCGSCCSNFIPVSPIDLRRIKAFVTKNNIKEQVTFYPFKNKRTDLSCPFFSLEDHKCLIYSVRPLICRRFICNQPKDLILEQKEELLKLYGMIDLRKEIYNNPVDINSLFQEAINDL